MKNWTQIPRINAAQISTMNSQESRGPITCSLSAETPEFAGLGSFWRHFLTLFLCGALAQAGFGVRVCAFSFAQTRDNRFESLLQEGFELHRQQRYRRAIPLLEQARALRPADYFVNLLLGIDHLRLGDARRAVPRLESARKARNHDS